jgi:predicted alpha/beta hydrolase
MIQYKTDSALLSSPELIIISERQDIMNTQELTIATVDGYRLKASEFIPIESNGIGLIINGATGVIRKYYQTFAEFLCTQGFTVLTYDFRGIGESTESENNALKPSMIHWGQQDMDAVLSFFIQRHTKLTIKGIGHSIGGQLLGIMPDNNRYESFLSIASQHIYWKNWPLKDRPLTIMFFFAILPLFYKLTGGLPKWVLGAEYLPKHVARDWSRFGRKKAYIADENGQPLRKGFSAYRGKMRLYSISDDKRFAPPNCVRKLEKLYHNAETDIQTFHPNDYGMQAIDHFGFFKKNMNKKAWFESAEWLMS